MQDHHKEQVLLDQPNQPMRQQSLNRFSGTGHKAVSTSLSASQQVEECGFAGPTGAH